MHDRRLAARAGELQASAVRELLKHSKLPGVISLGGGIPARNCLIPKAWSWRCRR
ncbi:transcriptional regulator [Klebsiella pneumoniae]|uniref:Transcriptional regulator n=1 Tax=Klebsiella pneumoniae TaxID=573 RepID=A0A3S4GYS2_KLEPN|nr:transcriptional regulator [Klebsiella pneumoniae]